MDHILIKLDGIKGESKLAKEEIEVLSYSHGVSMPVTHSISGAQRSSGRCVMQDFTFTKHVDITTPVFNKKCAAGENVKTITMRHMRVSADGKEALPLITYKFDDALVTSVSVGGGSSDQPVETITFNFAKVTWTYGAQGRDATKKGQAEGSYDVETNKVA